MVVTALRLFSLDDIRKHMHTHSLTPTRSQPDTRFDFSSHLVVIERLDNAGLILPHWNYNLGLLTSAQSKMHVDHSYQNMRKRDFKASSIGSLTDVARLRDMFPGADNTLLESFRLFTRWYGFFFLINRKFSTIVTAQLIVQRLSTVKYCFSTNHFLTICFLKNYLHVFYLFIDH